MWICQDSTALSTVVLALYCVDVGPFQSKNIQIAQILLSVVGGKSKTGMRGDGWGGEPE